MKMIETKRLVLKNYAADEKENLISLLTDKRVMKHVDRGVFSREKAEALWVKLIEKSYPQGIRTIWAVFAKDDSRYIGHAAIRPRPTKKEDWEISYMLKTEEWGKGFATEIARRLIDYGFEDLNLTEVVATIDDDNFGSIKVVEKTGMSFSHYEYDDDGRFSVYSIKAETHQRT
ncbi:MAG TPA: GNAT family N-acetyltransferase [Pyrinomonadaceae bacterium]|nr:GNAT family N-acetyltransferase [Pyrinomonadaceae bacterium]